MRLHTDVLTSQDIHAATSAAGMRGVTADVTAHGSRSRARAFAVTLTGTSSRYGNQGTRSDRRGNVYNGPDRAATWDEWGMFLAALYATDPDMLVGAAKSPIYASAEDFHAVTRGRFRQLTAPHQHGRAGHRWDSDGGTMWCPCGAEREHPATTSARRAAVSA